MPPENQQPKEEGTLFIASEDGGSALVSIGALAPESTIIELDAGIFVLAQPLILSRSVTLRGRGPDSTTIQSERGDVIRISGHVEIKLEGLTIRCAGSIPGSPLSIDDAAQVEIRDCGLSGGTARAPDGDADDPLSRGGVGLLIRGHAKVRLEGSRVTHNGGYGIVARGQSTTQVWSCDVRENGFSGILFADDAVGSVKDTRCEANARNGIGADDRSSVSIEGASCLKNGLFGAMFRAEASGRLAGSQLAENQQHGVYLQSTRPVRVEDNDCSSNEFSGIVVIAGDEAVVLRNQCRGNGEDGIVVAQNAAPHLEANECSENGKLGIGYLDASHGRAEVNVCSRNWIAGIEVQSEAAPTLVGNVCERNERSGLVYNGHTSGYAIGNQCNGNGLHGILIAHQARPSISESVCETNHLFGLMIADAASPVIQRNRFKLNGMYGIAVGDVAAPRLDENLCEENGKYGIAFSHHARGTAIGNTCRANGTTGLWIIDAADPVMRGNTCILNTDFDILDWRQDSPQFTPTDAHVVGGQGDLDLPLVGAGESGEADNEPPSAGFDCGQCGEELLTGPTSYCTECRIAYCLECHEPSNGEKCGHLLDAEEDESWNGKICVACRSTLYGPRCHRCMSVHCPFCGVRSTAWRPNWQLGQVVCEHLVASHDDSSGFWFLAPVAPKDVETERWTDSGLLSLAEPGFNIDEIRSPAGGWTDEQIESAFGDLIDVVTAFRDNVTELDRKGRHLLDALIEMTGLEGDVITVDWDLDNGPWSDHGCDYFAEDPQSIRYVLDDQVEQLIAGLRKLAGSGTTEP